MGSRKPDKKAIKELKDLLERFGWVELKQSGSHLQYKNPNEPEKGKISVPVTGINENIKHSILRQMGLRKSDINMK